MNCERAAVGKSGYHLSGIPATTDLGYPVTAQALKIDFYKIEWGATDFLSPTN